MKSWVLVLAFVAGLSTFDAEAARRLGSGGSVGKQSPNVTQRDGQKGAPAQQAAPAPANTAAAAQPSRFGMFGAVAAGLGLAWLAHSLGFGEAFAQVLLALAVAMVVMVAIGWFMRSRRGPRAGPAYSYAGPAPAEVAQPPRQYSPDKVGNDASARPWERSSMAFDASKYAGQQAPSDRVGATVAGGAPAWAVPDGFDAAGFVTAAKANFVTLQEAWDRADTASLRSMMTDEMLREIQAQLGERERQLAGQANHTEVVMLEAQLLGIEDLGGDYMASVEFSGMIREDASAGPSPFREVWNMTKPKNGSSGWLVAGVQALQ